MPFHWSNNNLVHNAMQYRRLNTILMQTAHWVGQLASLVKANASRNGVAVENRGGAGAVPLPSAFSVASGPHELANGTGQETQRARGQGACDDAPLAPHKLGRAKSLQLSGFKMLRGRRRPPAGHLSGQPIYTISRDKSLAFATQPAASISTRVLGTPLIHQDGCGLYSFPLLYHGRYQELKTRGGL